LEFIVNQSLVLNDSIISGNLTFVGLILLEEKLKTRIIGKLDIKSNDDKIDWLHFHTTTTKFGLGRASYDSAQEIRNGDITRAEGVALVKRFDGEFLALYLNDCCEYMVITLETYHEAIERFRTPHLWQRKYGKWELKYPIWGDDK
jgi:hypothetical protein